MFSCDLCGLLFDNMAVGQNQRGPFLGISGHPKEMSF